MRVFYFKEMALTFSVVVVDVEVVIEVVEDDVVQTLLQQAKAYE
jgi:hypothetical protein